MLDTPSEDRFDTLVKMGARYFDVPCCLISLVDRERIWFKAAVGIEDPEVARTEGLCATTIQGPDLYHLRDASQDEVASKNPLVSPSDGIRFYAGHPLETRDGLNLGSFCVMGHEPRDLSEGDREYLTEIARLAIYEIERRYAQEELQKLNVELDFRIHTRTKALDSVIQDLEAEVKARVEASEAYELSQQRRVAELSGDYCFELDFSDLSRVQLREARRLTWLGTVAAGMAHPIHNPVGAMLAAVQFALHCEDQREEREIWKKALLDVEAEAKRCGAIARGIRRFARGESAAKKREDLVEVVTSARPLVDSYAEGRRVQIETQECAEPIPVKMSKVDIEEMLIDILRNTIESGPKSPVQIRLEANQDTAMIEIEDDGCGVSAERRHEVFDPFFTTRLEQGGTGLGLSIADGIVADHKATIELAAREGSGTRVTIRLPLDLSA